MVLTVVAGRRASPCCSWCCWTTSPTSPKAARRSTLERRVWDRSPTRASRRAEGIARAWPPPLTAGAPWLSRRWRRWGWVAVVGLVVTRFLAAPMSFDSLEAVLDRLVRRRRGARRPRRADRAARPPTASRQGLARSGLPLESLEGGERRRPRLHALLRRRRPTARRYFVKALGDDQRSADLLFRIYRSVQRHDLGDERPFSSLRRAVEHEAFVALAARDLGILTPRVARLRLPPSRTASCSPTRRSTGQSLDGVPPGGDHRRRARPTCGSSSADLRVPADRPPRPAPRQHLPRQPTARSG